MKPARARKKAVQGTGNPPEQSRPGIIEPAYDRRRPLVHRLESVAMHMPMIRRVKALALVETPEGVLPPVQAGTTLKAQEIWQVYVAEETRRARRREFLDTHPQLADDINLMIDWVVFGNQVARASFLSALSVYEQALLDWSGTDLAAIHTIWACLQLWETGHDGATATEIRERAIDLWEQTELDTGQPPCTDKLYRVEWSRLFVDLGIERKFPRGGYHNKQ
jgi:hypothetical protein